MTQIVSHPGSDRPKTKAILGFHSRLRNRHSHDQRVLVHGTPFFGELFAQCMGGDGWKFTHYPDRGIGNLTSMFAELRNCDMVYQVGGRATLGKFLRTAKYLGKKRVVMHWIGSDVLEAQSALIDTRAEPWLTSRALHWAETPWMVNEVSSLGFRCETMPLPGARLNVAPSPLPPEFSVLVYIPGTQEYACYGSEATRVSDFYGLEAILEVARSLPRIPFHMVGATGFDIEAKPANLQVHGQVSDLTEFYKRATVLWRPIRHDGLSFMVLEALAHARHVLWSYDFPACIKVGTSSEAREQIERLARLHEKSQLGLNLEGPRVVNKSYAPQVIRKNILNRLEELMRAGT